MLLNKFIMLNLNNLSKFVGNITTHYHETRQKINSGELYQDLHLVKYKIVGSYDEYVKTGKLLVQSKRGSAYAYFTPNEIIEDETILSHLHPIDATIIAKLINEGEAQDKNIQPTAKITKQYFSEEKNTYIYEIQQTDSDELVKLTQIDILDNPHLIEQLNSRDAMSIGCQMGLDSARKIK